MIGNPGDIFIMDKDIFIVIDVTGNGKGDLASAFSLFIYYLLLLIIIYVWLSISEERFLYSLIDPIMKDSWCGSNPDIWKMKCTKEKSRNCYRWNFWSGGRYKHIVPNSYFWFKNLFFLANQICFGLKFTYSWIYGVENYLWCWKFIFCGGKCNYLVKSWTSFSKIDFLGWNFMSELKNSPLW